MKLFLVCLGECNRECVTIYLKYFVWMESDYLKYFLTGIV